MRKSNINLDGYSKIINPKLLDSVTNRNHTMANMPYYNKVNEPEKLYEEKLFEERFKELSDSYANTFDVNKDNIQPLSVIMNTAYNGMVIDKKETPKRIELCELAERIAREEFNLGEDEIIFDLEIVSPGQCALPKECNKKKEVEKDFIQSTDFDILKKRTINALSQGSALKSHYIFHLYHDEFEKLCPGITENYQKALIGNDLLYFMMSDDEFKPQLDNDNNNAGYCSLNFEGDIPVIKAKAINTPILIHEITKAIISFLSIPGIQNMSEETIDETDFIMAELWDVRFGPTIWQNFHSIIDIDDYDIKKIIIMELFKLDSKTFITEFMQNVQNDIEWAKIYAKRIAKEHRKKMSKYAIESDSI